MFEPLEQDGHQITLVDPAINPIFVDHAEPLHAFGRIEGRKKGKDESAQNARFEDRKHVEKVLALVSRLGVGYPWDVHGGSSSRRQAKQGQPPPLDPLIDPALGKEALSHEFLGVWVGGCVLRQMEQK